MATKALGNCFASAAAPLIASNSQRTFAVATPRAASMAGPNLYRKAEDNTSITAGPGSKPPLKNTPTMESQTPKDMRAICAILPAMSSVK